MTATKSRRSASTSESIRYLGEMITRYLLHITAGIAISVCASSVLTPALACDACCNDCVHACDSDNKDCQVSCREFTGNSKLKCMQQCSALVKACNSGCQEVTCHYEGSVYPRYFILTVVYAPPGSGGATQRSSVQYSSDSTLGTLTTVANSFRLNYSTTVTAGAKWIGASAETSVTASTSNYVDATNTQDVRFSSRTGIGYSGSGVDGIYHDRDLIYLWLNPGINIIVDGNNIQWNISQGGDSVRIQWVSVGQLKHTAQIPAGVVAELEAAGVTRDDYATILSQVPTAYGAGMSTDRCVSTGTTIPYEPPMDKTFRTSPQWTKTVNRLVLLTRKLTLRP